jgi:predicted lipoprotein with Yx(FWY)xxD motif
MRLAHVDSSVRLSQSSLFRHDAARREKYLWRFLRNTAGHAASYPMQANCMTGETMTTSPIRLALALAVSLAIIPAAFAAPPTKTGKTDKGNVLTDAKGMSLYTFDKDADGKSACNGPCATNWPALKAEASDAAADGYTIITRDDGSKQWAHKGKPLYTFAKDTKPGDVTGDGFLNGAWHLATP